jgi:hypothetical protein
MSRREGQHEKISRGYCRHRHVRSCPDRRSSHSVSKVLPDPGPEAEMRKGVAAGLRLILDLSEQCGRDHARLQELEMPSRIDAIKLDSAQ